MHLDKFSQQNNTESSNEHEGYCFHIISDFISQDSLHKLKLLESNLNQRYPCQIKTHIIDDSIFRPYKKWGFNGDKSYSAYYRLLIDEILPSEVTKALYLDTDMLVLCDIRELFALDLKGKILAASNGFSSPFSCTLNFKARDSGKDLVTQTNQYFCSGLLLIDMEQWRKNDILSKCISFLENYITDFANQDAINVAITDSFILPPHYGLYLYQYIIIKHNQEETIKLQKIMKHIKIIHCNGPAKAWSSFFIRHSDAMQTFVADRWWDMAQNTCGFEEEFKLRKLILDYSKESIIQNDEHIKTLEHNISKLEEQIWRLRHPYKYRYKKLCRILKSRFVR
ncbi:glycosyltransferase family 8 protein [Helicobacter sp. MIT 05-5293]|uniref:glycosyltransferase family 8 protein n=1 Tax=Helicobacter sp. MIT 05-5293 TaxID=1548149 RepID=UPI00241112B2|nr:glycosyltransferase family 8 protein [Helicobacter sp. MIT 05-5293]